MRLRTFRVLVGDALYLQAPFVKQVERLGLVWAFILKAAFGPYRENQPDLLREAERLTQESPTGVHAETDREIRYWHLPEVDWPVADRLVRVVKTVRIEHRRRVTVGEKDGQRTKSKTAAPQESTNFYATNFELGSISPLFIHQFSRSRWRIDTEVFQTISTDCHLKHPAVHWLEVTTDDSRMDIVAGGFDAGIHFGEYIEKDMIAVRVSPDQRPAIVGSPSYFESHAKPRSPRDLIRHRCINFRHGSAGVYRWEFEKGRKSLSVAVNGPLIVDDVQLVLRAAVDGVGLAFLSDEQVVQHLANGTLVRVLEPWCQPYPGFFLY